MPTTVSVAEGVVHCVEQCAEQANAQADLASTPAVDERKELAARQAEHQINLGIGARRRSDKQK